MDLLGGIHRRDCCICVSLSKPNSWSPDPTFSPCPSITELVTASLLFLLRCSVPPSVSAGPLHPGDPRTWRHVRGDGEEHVNQRELPVPGSVLARRYPTQQVSLGWGNRPCGSTFGPLFCGVQPTTDPLTRQNLPLCWAVGVLYPRIHTRSGSAV